MLKYSISISFHATLTWCFLLLLNSSHANETDRLSLLAIKSKLHDPLGVTSSWNNSINLCQWSGVTCGHRHPRVTKLDLRNQSIGGFLSPYVGNLSFLRYINIADNSFYGEIPHEISRLIKLETLVLANNSFSGKIPTNLSLCSNLITFYARKNNLVGEIPPEIGYLLKLEILSFGENHLTGELPSSIGNISTLQVIIIRGNRLGGRIPSTFGKLRNLVHLNFGRNQFSGTVHPLCNISSLEYMYVHDNRFHGNLPLDIGPNLPNLRVFVVYKNNLTDSLPDSLSNASNIESIDLSNNQFIGKVSINFGGLKNLSRLVLENSNLGTGATNDLDFVTLLTNCSKLNILAFNYNRFGGVLPHSITNLSTKMTFLSMGNNQISGTIPLGIRNLANLNTLGIEHNQLTGTIPHVIGELKNLQLLHLYANFLQGSIPSSLGNLSILTILDLSFNNLHGKIPSSLGNCKNLNSLSLSKNRLTGALPREILGITTLSLILDLYDNLLNGSFPRDVGNLKNLGELYISENRFSSEIPDTLSDCTSLEYLYMDHNSFSGGIPLSLRSLKSIKELDLSSNNLSGQIPEYLENLAFLEYLNLSYNHLEGKVPTKGVFNNITEFSLVRNGKLCGGLDELQLPSCNNRRSRKLNLLKVVIPVIASCLIFSACFIVAYSRRRRFAQKSFETLPMEQQFPMVSYAELNTATGGFSSSNMIGQGSFGFVYKGVLGENGMIVAVKVINLKKKGASRSFMAECEALRNIRHRNLIKIITICSSIDQKGDDFKALVYEYMERGSLEELLHQSNDQLEMCSLRLIQRLNIAIDVASVVEYLHHHCQPPIIHGDLKPSNILLDQDMVAHVSDFGLAKILFDQPLNNVTETQSSSIGIKGTVGYVPPEYGMGGELSMPGDVYSFGILLLEMFTGKRPTDNIFNGGLTLYELAKMALPEKIMEIVDPSLFLDVRTGYSTTQRDEKVKIEECLVAVLRTGVLCSTESSAERIKMTDAVSKLRVSRDYFLRTKA